MLLYDGVSVRLYAFHPQLLMVLVEKYLQALRALESVRRIDSNHPHLHYRIIDLQVVGKLYMK
jgi:hypothetical protein